MKDILKIFAPYLVLALLVILLLWYLKKKAGDAIDSAENAAKTVGTAINPVDDKNIFNQASNWLTQKLTSDPNATLGSKIYDWTH